MQRLADEPNVLFPCCRGLMDKPFIQLPRIGPNALVYDPRGHWTRYARAIRTSMVEPRSCFSLVSITGTLDGQIRVFLGGMSLS